ncbi:DNA polymerase III subunit delta [Anaerospora sp.]|uniref:DNA polymerase III subunit delta n=1 Tax=Anaerospora sp. TaxID=1960278 RepID=UPI00289C4F6F|nr:DNA polymerase III subunit delta [Anaerospora sp.]
MNYSTAMEQINRGQIASIYLLYGEESYLIRELEHKLTVELLPPDERETGLAVFENEPSSEELVRLIESVPFFGSKNVILVRNAAMFRSRKASVQAESADAAEETADAGSERLITLFANMPDYTNVVFIGGDKIDKRKKIVKAIEKYGSVIELAPLKVKDVKPWVMAKLAEKNKKLTADAMEHLLNIVSIMPQVSLGFLAGELEKACLYTKTKTSITRDDLMAILSIVPEVSVFVMLEALSQKQVSRALQLLGEQLSTGELPFRLLALLARQVRHLWQAKLMAGQGFSQQDVANEFKVPLFIGEKLIRQSRAFSAEQLKAGILRLAAADRDLKTGKADGHVLEQFIIELCL